MSAETLPIVEKATTFSVSVKQDKKKRFYNRAKSAQISVKDFFDFMKTAYQVNDSIEQLVPELLIEQSAGADWSSLADNKLVNQLMETTDGNGNVDVPIKIETECQVEPKSRESAPNEAASNKHAKNVVTKEITEDISLPTTPNSDQPVSFVHDKLNEILAEGLLDSILPYLVPAIATTSASTHQPVIKKHHSHHNTKKHTTSGDKVEKIPSSTSVISHATNKTKKREEGSVGSTTSIPEPEVEIHVCDEVKHMKKDFRCPQKLLISKMGYFAEVTAGQKLEEMDISVHCDIGIFDWLMRWVKQESILPEDQPTLDATCVVPILVSAAFLQMEPLMEDCLRFCHEHMNEIIKTSTNLACLNDSIITRLGAMYTNSELESIRDKKDKILSRLYCKMILALGDPMPQSLRGHWSTLATIFRCCKCGKLVSSHEGVEIPCVASCMMVDQRGEIISEHIRDTGWNLSDFIVQLYHELKSWRRVYWRLWSICHFMRCNDCLTLFPAHQMGWCCYHSEQPQFFTTEGQRGTAIPIGRYPCCGGRTYRFEVLTNISQGCQFKDHYPSVRNPRDLAILSLFNQNRQIIEQPPPQIMIPERLTKLVAREVTNETGIYTNKEIFWWEGIELAPPRQKLGLLGKMNFVRQANPPPVPSVSSESSSEEDSEEDNDLSGSSSNSGSKDSLASDNQVIKKYKPRKAAKRKYKKRSGISGRHWSPTLSARSNQDLQRDFEENAMQQITDFLSRRTSGNSESVLFQKTAPPLIHKAPQHLTSIWSHHITPIGGVYQRLEAEWCEINRQPFSQPTKNARSTFQYIVKPKFRVHRNDK